MTMNMSRKINMLLQIETCEYFIEFVGVSIRVIYMYVEISQYIQIVTSAIMFSSRSCNSYKKLTLFVGQFLLANSQLQYLNSYNVSGDQFRPT